MVIIGLPELHIRSGEVAEQIHDGEMTSTSNIVVRMNNQNTLDENGSKTCRNAKEAGRGRKMATRRRPSRETPLRYKGYHKCSELAHS